MRAALFRGVYAGVRAYEKNLSRFFQLLFGKIFFARRGNFVRKGGSEREGVGQDAIAILYLDQVIDPKVIETLENTGLFQQVKALEFEVN